MSKLQAPAQACARTVELVDADHLIERLTGLAKREEECGRISHSLGVRRAIALIQRDLSAPAQANKFLVSVTHHQ